MSAMTRPIRILCSVLTMYVFFADHGSRITDCGIAEADIPRTIHYQGKLEEADGSQIFGEHMVTMRLYDAPTGGAKLWEERHDLNFTVEDKGAISLDLGSKTPFAGLVTFTDPVWLSIEVDATGELVPRQALTATGYAINADRLDGLDSTELLAKAGTGDITAVNAGAGLLGSAASGDATLDVGAGAGILVGADAVSVDVGTTAGKIVQLDGAGTLPAVSGSNLTGLNASNLSSGTVPDARLSAGVSLLGPTIESAELTDTTIVAADTSDTFLTAGSGATVTKTAASWQISATGTGGNRVTQSASNTLAISTVGDTTLLSATITKSQASSVLLVLSTVQLNHTSGPSNKTVDVKLFRDATQLDSGYEVRLGTADRAVSDIPVSLHTVDTSGAGTYTFTLRASSTGNGAEARVRRLTVLELL